MVGWKRKQRGSAFEGLAPVRQVGIQDLALHPFPLPGRVVGILDLKRINLWFSLFEGCRIKFGKIVEQYSSGPSIAGDVVRVQTENMVFLTQPNQHATHGRAGR